MTEKKAGLSKGILALIIGIVVVIISGSIYFFMGGGSLKQQYFMAEKNTLDEMQDYIENRYEAELDWLGITQEKPTKSSLDLSAEYNDPSNGMSGMGMDPAEIINNSTIQILTESDTANKQLNATLNADVAGMSFKDFKFYLSEDKLTVDLPFLNDELMIHDKDIVSLINEIEPGSIPEETEINFSEFFEAQSQGMSDEDLEYLKDEYGKLIYKEIPESAFESESGKTTVNGEEVKAEKITMHLSEEEVQSILTKVFDKLENDERVKEMLESQYNTLAAQEMITDFEDGIKEIKESIPDLKMPEGLTSSIWEKDDVVVNRSFTTEIENEGNLVAFEITGNQIIDEKESSLDYEMVVNNQNDTTHINLVGLMTEEDEGNKDDISLQMTSESEDFDMELNYLADEKTDGDTTDFERTFAVSESGEKLGALHWNGQASYEKDQMKSNHSLAVEAEGLSRDLFILNIDVASEQIKEVASADPEAAKDLGKMSGDEVMEYIQTDVAEQFNQWLMTQMPEFQ